MTNRLVKKFLNTLEFRAVCMKQYVKHDKHKVRILRYPGYLSVWFARQSFDGNANHFLVKYTKKRYFKVEWEWVPRPHPDISDLDSIDYTSIDLPTIVVKR